MRILYVTISTERWNNNVHSMENPIYLYSWSFKSPRVLPMKCKSWSLWKRDHVHVELMKLRWPISWKYNWDQLLIPKCEILALCSGWYMLFFSCKNLVTWKKFEVDFFILNLSLQQPDHFCSINEKIFCIYIIFNWGHMVSNDLDYVVKRAVSTFISYEFLCSWTAFCSRVENYPHKSIESFWFTFRSLRVPAVFALVLLFFPNLSPLHTACWRIMDKCAVYCVCYLYKQDLYPFDCFI